MKVDFGVILSVVSTILGMSSMLFTTVTWTGLSGVKKNSQDTRNSLNQLDKQNQLSKHSLISTLNSYKNMTDLLHEKIRRDLDYLIKKEIIHIKETDDINNRILRTNEAVEMHYKNLDQRVESNSGRIRTNENKLRFLDKHRSINNTTND